MSIRESLIVTRDYVPLPQTLIIIEKSQRVQRILKGPLFTKLEDYHACVADRRHSTHKLITLLKVDTESLLYSTKVSNYLILALLPINEKYFSRKSTLHRRVKNFVVKIMSLKVDEGERHRRPQFSSVSDIPSLNDRFLQILDKIDTVSYFPDDITLSRAKEKNHKVTHLLEVQWCYYRQLLNFSVWNWVLRRGLLWLNHLVLNPKRLE